MNTSKDAKEVKKDVAHILVVDDDPDVLINIQEYLVRHGYRVSVAADGDEMRKVFEEQDISLVILDMVLPGESGIELAAFISQNHHAGIIMITGFGEAVDRIVSLEIGADDYLSKPLDLRELLARVRSLLRRLGARSAKTGEGSKCIEFSGWQLDIRRRQLISPSGDDVDVTTLEFDLLVAMTERPNRVLTRDNLMDMTKGREWNPLDRSIDNLILRLRRKIEDDPKNPKLIKTVRGVGYMFTSAPD